MDEWINARIKLPEYYVDVLVTDGNKIKVALYAEGDVIDNDCDEYPDRWTCEDDIDILDSITHWMPLPNLPNL